MNVERSSGPDVLPSRYVVERLDPALRETFFAETESLSEDLRRTAFWSHRLMAAFDTREAATTIPGFILPAFGFLDPESEQDAFGVIVLAQRSVNGSHLLEMEYRRDLVVDDHRCPIVVRQIDMRLHLSDPPGGTTACLATSRRGQRGPGFLTAKHVVGSLGSVVPLSCGCAGHVCDVGPEGIDVALVRSKCATITGTQVYPKRLVPPWLDVAVRGSSSGIWHTKVSAVSDTRGILTSPYLPAGVFLARAGRGGDSGGLVSAVGDNEPAGIYLGELTDPAGRTEGIAQHCYQAANLMDLELFT